MPGSVPSFSASDSFLRESSTLRTIFFLMTFREACACSVSRDTLSGSVSESTIPFRKLRYLQKHAIGSPSVKNTLTYQQRLSVQRYSANVSWEGIAMRRSQETCGDDKQAEVHDTSVT